MTLVKKRILLTGGSGGIGQFVAAALLREGADLTVLSRTRTDEEVNQPKHVRADLSTTAGIAQASAIIVAAEPDILINMAGVQYFGPAERQPLDDLQAGYLVNLVAPAALCSACLPAMKRRNSGQIVNIGSIFGSIPSANFAAYSSAKSGVRAFSEALRREIANTKIAVTYIAPRAVRTGMLTAQLKRYAELTGMSIDFPEIISEKIVTAIKQRKKDVYVGFPEKIFVRLNAIFPRLVDAAVAGADRNASTLFTA
jgi:short-subunit dehydrogenase